MLYVDATKSFPMRSTNLPQARRSLLGENNGFIIDHGILSRLSPDVAAEGAL